MNNETNKPIIYELGHIYGSKISKSGKWLNLIITADHGNETLRITCPVQLEADDMQDDKPYAIAQNGGASILNVSIYEETKKPVEEPKADDLPF